MRTPTRRLPIRFVSALRGALLPLFLFAIPALTGCGGGNSSPTAITLTGPSSDTIDPGDSATFNAAVTGGPLNAGVLWSLTNCTVSSCGTLTNTTTASATYTAPPSVATAFTVTLTVSALANSTLKQTLTLSVPVNPTITTPAGALPGATYGTAYTTPLVAAGGIAPYSWSISAGALPAGLTLSSTTGAISGSPTSGGTASFTVKLTDSGSPALSSTTAFTLTTLYTPISITTTSLPHGTEGTAYAATLAATGGNGAYTFAVTSGTGLSAVGLTLASNGTITGIPTTGETNIPVTIQVTDTAGNTASATLTVTVTAVPFQGQVLSGTTPINNATIQLYAAGATGNASTATPMLTQTVISDGLGMFQLTGAYTCGQSSSGNPIPATAQLYLVATGGTTSTTSTTSNPALTMVTAVGPCSNLATAFTTLNELTTAAAAWALAPFATSATTIGATSTNTLGLTNAFLDAALLANPATGAAATLPANLTVESAKLAALADALSTCASTPCTALLTAATNGSTAPTDTFTAALSIVKNPGQNVAAIFATLPSTPPFPTTLTTSPNDWTMSLTVTGGGLNMPTALGIDTQNNIWVANQDGPLSAFNPQGTPLSPTGYAAGAIAQTYGLAIDTANNIWVTNYNGDGGTGSVTEIFGIGAPGTVGTSPTLGTSASFGDSICYPTAAAADTNGDIFIANEECSSATVLSPSGTAVTPFLGQSLGLAAKPLFLAVDTTHGLWLSDNDNTIAHISAPSAAYPNGQLLAHPTCCYDSHGLVTDAQGNVWVANYLNSSISEVAPDGTILLNQQTVSNGTATPYAAAIDASQTVWFTSLDSSALLELSGSSSAHPGTELSPSTGVHGHGGFGYDSSLIEPYSLAPDRSGNLWVSDNGENTLVMFFGLATPTLTPLLPTPTAP